MRIGIDARAVVRPEIGRVSGVHQYTSQIIAALMRLAPDEVVLFGDEDVHASLRGVPFIGHHLALPQAIHRAGVDVFFSPTGLVPLGLTVPSVAFIHDLFILKHPEWFPDSVLQQLFTLKLVLPRSVRRARHILVPSASVKQDLVEAYPEVEGKTSVVWEGVVAKRREDCLLTSAMRERMQVPRRYIVSVATVEPRKNLSTAVKAFEALLSARPALAKELQYVIAGNPGWGSASVFAEIEAMNARWRHHTNEVIRYVGPVSEEEKWALYANAEVYVSVSLAEGFGLPPFEAMAVATPVMTTAVGAIAEVAADAVAFVRADDPLDMKQTLLGLLDDESRRTTLAQKGFYCAQKLTWEKAAEQTLHILRRSAQS